jgi:acyl-coenzyme A synthetase/AMP-(fatty) acid ligase
MAAWLKANLPGRDEAPVCLAAEDRGLVAAALLTSLQGGPVLLFPHAFSGQVLADMQKDSGYRLAISESERDFPPGIKHLAPPASLTANLAAGVGEKATLATPPPVALTPAALTPAAGPLGPDAELLRLYTGGSTGRPRLWRKTVANVFGEVAFWRDYFQISADDRIVATVPPWHIYGFLHSIVMPLISGAAVAPETPSFPEEIALAAHSRKATILISAPPHYRALRGKALATPSLRFALSSAGPLSPEDNDAFCQANGLGIIEIYGSTETGGVACRNRFQGEEALVPPAPVAWRLKNGGLLVASPWLSPELPRDEDGFFVTGDRAETAGRGFVLKGRIDSVAKVAGKRVDLEEVAATVRGFAGVTDCLVMALAEDSGRSSRIAVVAAGGVEAERLKRFLAGRLESHALPRIIKTVRQIPTKENGKYDREAVLRLLGVSW